MFDKLQSLPLFIGLGVSDLMRIVELVDFDFNKYREGATFAAQGDRCDRIIYVLGGEMSIERIFPNRELMVTEWTDTRPFAVELENLWGMRQVFNHSYTFTTEGSTCSIEKRSLTKLINSYDIVRTNLLSTLCNEIQRQRRELLTAYPSETEEKVLRFFARHSLLPNGRKEFRVKMRQLGNMIDENRLRVSGVLNEWEQAGLVELGRGVCRIPDIGKLHAYYETKHSQA